MDFPTLTADQARSFDRDGFLVLERFIDPAWADALARRFEPLFAGRFETGLMPDEWNWREGRDPPDRARQICNGWRADRAIAGLVLQAGIGRLVAGLAGWPGARIAQDNVIWKPPGATPLGFHQDNSYNGWIVPGEMLSCWVALDPTSAAGGTIEYVRGSHRWGRFAPATAFHAPSDSPGPRRRRRVGRPDAGDRRRRGAARRLRLPSRLGLARLGRQPRPPAATFAGVALHVVGRTLPPDGEERDLQPLPAGRRRHDG